MVGTGANNGDNNNALTGKISPEFLATECDVITSNPVVAMALNKIGDIKTLSNVDPDLRISYLKDRLTAEVSKKGQSVDVSFDSHNPDDAKTVVAAVVDSYQIFQADHWKGKVQQSLSLLQQGKVEQQQELEAKTQRMLQLSRQFGITSDSDPDKNPARLQVADLAAALAKAHLETVTARSAYNEAAKAIVGDPVKLQEVAEAEKEAAYAANPGAQLAATQTELFEYQARLSDAQRLYMPEHPMIKTIKSRIDQLTVACVAASEQWWEASQSAEEALQKSLDEAQKVALEQEASAVEYSRLASDVTQLKKMDEVVDARMNEIDLVQGAGATNISVLDPAEIVGAPSPQKARTLPIGLVLGLIAGIGLACVRDWMEDRLRTPDAITSTLGSPVLGAVPVMDTAFTAADRGQVVHHDPLSNASEAYRTLRTALQFSLPARTKTMLITSPAPGDGKSTFVSNLAIAMVQTGKRVLIVDADFRAPMQHRLFGLKDRAGLATVLGGDDQLDQVIQHTEVEGLDVLPCGPIPNNPAEMLNDPSFSDKLNDLADMYDMVLLDSPPVTAVTDARIIAACADVTVLVIRPTASTRKQAIEARDGLRSVGARLIGIAVNGVASGSHFGGPTGYYSRSARSDAAITPAKSTPPRRGSTVKPASAPAKKA
jgi:capsular exopolysaccharide synthesis family protein